MVKKNETSVDLGLPTISGTSEKDQFGGRIGSLASKVNSLLTEEYQTTKVLRDRDWETMWEGLDS